MSLSITEILANPEAKKALEAIYGQEEVTTLVATQLTNPAVKKMILEGIEKLEEPEVLIVMIRLALLLLTPNMDAEQISELEVLKPFFSEEFPNTDTVLSSATLLEDTELKLILKAATKLPMFVTRHRKEGVAPEVETPVECPLDDFVLGVPKGAKM